MVCVCVLVTYCSPYTVVCGKGYADIVEEVVPIERWYFMRSGMVGGLVSVGRWS